MIYNQRDIWQGRSFDIYGEYSEEEVRLYQRLLTPSNTVVEVGANIGSMTIPLSRAVPNGVVMSFEPERTAFYTLAGNIAINNIRNAFCYHQAMGSKTGVLNVPELDMTKTDNFGGLELDKDYSNGPHYPVGINTIDNLNMKTIDLIKIDVEGMELPVLEGGDKTIETFAPHLIVEDDRPDKSEALRNFIRSKGYKMFLHEAPFFNPKNWNGVTENVFSNVVSVNLFCHKREIDFDPTVEFGMRPVL